MERSPSRMTGQRSWVKWKWNTKSRSSSCSFHEVRMMKLEMAPLVSLVRLGSAVPPPVLLLIPHSPRWRAIRAKRGSSRTRHSPHPDCRRLRSCVRDRSEQPRQHSRHDRVQQDQHRKPTQNRHDQSRQQNVCTRSFVPPRATDPVLSRV
jgi:hypothetical protein